MVHLIILLHSIIFVSISQSCPKESQWQMRAKAYCKKDYREYRCFVKLNSLVPDFTFQLKNISAYIEECNGSNNAPPGFKLGFRHELLDTKQCSGDHNQSFYFDPFSNINCINIKSPCNEEGQISMNEGSAAAGRFCSCDFKKGYSFLFKPQYSCYCKPSDEDCTCYNKVCPENMVLSPDYYCVQNNVPTNSKCVYFLQSQIRKDVTEAIPILEEKIYSMAYDSTTALTHMLLVALMWIFVTMVYIGCFVPQKLKDGSVIKGVIDDREEMTYATLSTGNSYVAKMDQKDVDINPLQQKEEKENKQEIIDYISMETKAKPVSMRGESTAVIHKYNVENATGELPYICRLPVVENMAARNIDIRSRKFSLGKPNTGDIKRTIMMVGATGSGKSTLINSMANHILGVRWTDNYRYKLIDLESDEISKINDQTISQTEWITCYTIHKGFAKNLDYTVNIIDTPGFGDTRGINHDKQIIEQIYTLFTEKGEKGIVFLDAVCFVIQAPLLRLTASEKYILDSVLALFGNDIKDNFCSLITFSDGSSPPVMKSLRTIREIPLLHLNYFTFNCGGTFTKEDTYIERFYWDMGCINCASLLKYVNTMETKSLLLSIEVLKCRMQFQKHALELKNLTDVSVIEIHKLQIELTKYKAENKRIQQSPKAKENIKLIKRNEEQVEFILKVIQSIKKRLHDIALRPDIQVDQYIDLLIASEETEKKQGFELRIDALNEYKLLLNYSHFVKQFNDLKDRVSSICQLIDNKL